jgi:hypothetical protein
MSETRSQNIEVGSSFLITVVDDFSKEGISVMLGSDGVYDICVIEETIARVS